MDYIDQDVYLVSGTLDGSWEVQIEYSSSPNISTLVDQDGYSLLRLTEDQEYKEYFLAIYDQDGSVEYSQNIKARLIYDSGDDEGDVYNFNLAEAPVGAGAHTLKLGSSVTGEIEWEHYFDPANRPQVEIGVVDDDPNDSALTIRWNAEQNQELHYWLQYSNKEGRPGSWPSGVEVEGGHVDLDLEKYPGSLGEGSRFRIVAYNSKNFGVFETPLIQVPHKPPGIRVWGT